MFWIHGHVRVLIFGYKLNVYLIWMRFFLFFLLLLFAIASDKQVVLNGYLCLKWWYPITGSHPNLISDQTKRDNQTTTNEIQTLKNANKYVRCYISSLSMWHFLYPYLFWYHFDSQQAQLYVMLSISSFSSKLDVTNLQR